MRRLEESRDRHRQEIFSKFPKAAMIGFMITTTPSLLSALAGIPVLTGINYPALTLLAREGTVQDFAAGEIIVREGDPGHSFFILVEGEVEVLKHLDRPPVTILAQLAHGTFFGEMCVVDLFQQMPDQYSIVLLNLARDLARRLRRLDEAFAARA